MPTPWKRIPVTNDPELAAALGRVAPYFEGRARAGVVHDLAIRGAEAVVNERAREDEALDALVALSVERLDTVDWDVLSRVDELAWGG